MNVLLSVKPKYATKIVEGEKKYEFRKRIFRREDIERVYIYSTSPVSKIIGVMNVEEILEGTAEEIWKKCSLYSGMTREEYFYYFGDKKKAFAIKIKNARALDKPIDPSIVFDVFTPPQSFCYLEEGSIFVKDEQKVARIRFLTTPFSRRFGKGKNFRRMRRIRRKKTNSVNTTKLTRKRKRFSQKRFLRRNRPIQWKFRRRRHLCPILVKRNSKNVLLTRCSQVLPHS